MEGEGSFYVNNNPTKKKIIARLRMTDRDVVWKAYEISRIGSFNGPYDNAGKKKVYIWQVAYQKEAAGLMMTLYPLMSERRQETIRYMLNLWRRV